MEANKKRLIQSGADYEHFFTKASGSNATIRRNANVYHTVEFVPKVVKDNAWQTAKLAKHLQKETTYETCRSIWQFVYHHIAYKKDADGYEQVRSPARAWHDRHTGVDCDCYTVFISSILWNLQIPHTLRITKYHRDYFQHIYPIVPLPNGRHITIDCVVNDFDYEEPYSAKKDYPMDLQYLSGLGGVNDDGMELLGKVVKKRIQNIKSKPANSLPVLSKKAKRKQAQVAPPINTEDAPPVYQPKKKGAFKKVVSSVNKVNPATVLLRNGLLASMKLNLMGVAAKLRWSYMSESKAVAKGIDRDKHKKLVQTRNKIEKIFHTAGGKPINLRKAILGGKGNKDKAVNGLGWVDGLNGFEGLDYVSEDTPISQLLGREIFYSENVDGMNGFDGFGALGEPITGAAIAAATAVVAAIAKNLKSIGDLFTKKNKDAANTDVPVEIPETPTPILPQVPSGNNNTEPLPSNTTALPPNVVTTPAPTPEEALPGQPLVKMNKQGSPLTVDDGSNEISNMQKTVAKKEATSEDDVPVANKGSATKEDEPKETFWDKNKKWIKPVGIGLGAVTLIFIGYKAMSGGSNNKASSAPSKPANGLNGVRRRKQNHQRKKQSHKKQQHHKHHIKAVALL